jgi:hypothetical protein
VQYADPPAPSAPARDRTLDAGRLLIGLGAVVLLISLFLDWYGEGRVGGSSITAWTSFEFVDLLLAALAIATIYAVIEGIAAPPGAPRPPAALLWFAGPLALILILASIIDEPPLVAGLDATVEAGAWIAVAAALAMTVGAALSTLRISVVVGARERREAGAGERREASADPAAETRTMRTEPGPIRPSSADPRVPPPR